MSKLDKDILFLILKELQEIRLRNDSISLYPCLLVNKTWCEITVPILWKNPAGLYGLVNHGTTNNLLLNTILLHLSKESRANLKNQGIDRFAETYQQQPLFNYISFWRYLDLQLVENMIKSIENIDESKISIIRNEIMNLFINRSTKFIALSIPDHFDYQLHHISGAEHCFSGLKSLDSYSNINQNILIGLSRISKSIKELTFKIRFCNNPDYSGIINLIEAQKILNEVYIIHCYSGRNESCKVIEESLIKSADNIHHLMIEREPITKFLSHLINLTNLTIGLQDRNDTNWSNLYGVSLPFLKVLKADYIPSNILASLIENTKGNLTEISISYNGDGRIFIQAIYQNCLNLKYLALSINNDSFSEFEKLLINCQHLNGLVIMDARNLYYDDLFKILIRSSPISLFRFKFFFNTKYNHKLKYLKLFLDNWKNRHPILLHLILVEYFADQHMKQKKRAKDLIEKCKDKGIIKHYDIPFSYLFETFEWIKRKPDFYN
ncbi:hypothetical protein C1645_835525 [Glomus cerebriforme]|uniref:F-box domain-containing protein n=1 Tax=Glomus cerebriforme TaxID=658196 RepID=A0A397S7L2_9GLOM|nr:hypothetical protein C1645_835525 [Glomus cerebriforme]